MLHLVMQQSWSYRFMRYGVENYGWFSNLCLDQSCRTLSWFLVAHSSVGDLPVAKLSKLSERCPSLSVFRIAWYRWSVDPELLTGRCSAELRAALDGGDGVGLSCYAVLYSH